MAEHMTHRERTMAALKGKEVDRPPISMWRHFYTRESSAEALAESMLEFQRRFDWDFMKVHARASYHPEAFGLKMRYDGDQPPSVAETPVREPDDWLKLEVPPLDRGPLAEQLHALELIASGLGGEVPFLATVFMPFAIIFRLVPSVETFLQHVREHFDKVQHALEVATESAIAFNQACMDRGASGLFCVPTLWDTTPRMPQDEYDRVARPYDMKVLTALPSAEFNILHVCQDHNRFPSWTDYPVQVFNWDALGEGNPGLAEGKALVGGRTVMGGLAHRASLKRATPESLTESVRRLKAEMGNTGWMLANGCSYWPEETEVKIRLTRQLADGT